MSESISCKKNDFRSVIRYGTTIKLDIVDGSQVSEDTKIENQMTDKWETHPYVVHFDFLGKDSMRYQNSIGVPKVSFFLYTVGTIK